MENPKLIIVNAPEGALEIVNRAARTCYRSMDKDHPETRENFIKGIIKSGHESVLEHCEVNFELSNISRACATQILRHRIASYSCESMRYVKMLNYSYITPGAVEANAEALRTFNKAVNAAKKAYAVLLDMGIKAEDARACLPIATCTRMFFSMNFRAIRHFLKERMSPRAQREVRMVALSMYEQIQSLYPWLVEDLTGLYESGLNKVKTEVPAPLPGSDLGGK